MCLARFIRVRIPLKNNVRCSISKNIMVEIKGEDRNTINWFSTKWPTGLKLNYQWALFTHINVVKPIEN